MDNRQIRSEARRCLWQCRWLTRLVFGTMLLGMCTQSIAMALHGMMSRLGVVSWSEYINLFSRTIFGEETVLPELTTRFAVIASSATALQIFIGGIMAGIFAYGSSVLLLRAVGNNTQGWIGAAFGGFRIPFELLALFIRRQLIFIGWALAVFLPALAIILAVEYLHGGAMAMKPVALLLACVAAGVITFVPFYRYRFLWLVKADHPEFTSGECVRFCRRMMAGHMLESFRLDCSYWRALTLLLALALAAFVGATVSWADPLTSLVVTVVLMEVFFLSMAIWQYVAVGQTMLYRSIAASERHDNIPGENL